MGCACSRGALGALTIRVPIVGSGRPGATRRVTIGTLDWRRLNARELERARGLGGLGVLGALGLNPLEQTVAAGVASKGAAVGAGLLATSAGIGTTFAPVIGTAVGAAVGLIATLVFGNHANYAQIAHDVASQMAMADTWKKIAGVYAGRAYGVKDMEAVWDGLLHEGFFTLNRSPNWSKCPVSRCIANPNSCIQAPGCGGTEAWVTDLFEGKAYDPAKRSLTGCAKTALSMGLNAIQAADQIFIPNWAHQTNKFTVPWAYPNNTQSPTLARQLIIDTLDAIMYQDDSSIPLSYGQVPSSVSSNTSASSAAVTSTSSATGTSSTTPSTSTATPSTSTATGTSSTTTPSTSSSSSVPSSVSIKTSTGQSGTLSTSALSSLVQSMVSQGQNSSQAYQSALAALESQGISTSGNSQLQSTLASLANSQGSGSQAVPSGSTAALSVGGTTISPTVLILGVGLVGAAVFMMWGRKH